MIQFKCPKCQKVLKVADEKAGVAIACPGCQAKLKVPTPKAAPEPVRKKKPAEDVEEVVPDEDDDVEEPKPRKKPAHKPAAEVEADDDEEDDRPRKKRGKKDSEGGGRQIVSGIVYIVLGIAVAAVGLIAPTMMELQVDRMIPMIFGPVAGLLIAGLGIFYLVRK